MTAPLEFTMLTVALLWRNDQWLRGAGRTADPATTPRRTMAGRSRRVASPADLPPGRT
jgi:hypothetical protein